MGWLSGYSKRKELVLTGGASGALSDFQLSIAVSHEAAMQGDFDDIRFTRADGTTLVDAWAEVIITDTSATVWVEFPSTPANTVEQTYYMYYGNGSAVSDWNITDTFPFGDDNFLEMGGVLNNAPSYQTTPTYDTSGQVVHPDVIYFSGGWNGYKYWMGMTPYPNSNDDYENPSIIASNDGSSWEVPSGLTNPISPEPGVGHNCDVDLVYNDTTDELWIYWLEKPTGGDPNLYYSKSSDGTTWASKTFVLDLGGYSVSPAIIKQGSNWYMWYVDPGSSGCSSTSTTVYYRTSADGLTWGSAQSVTISQSGYNIWHLDVIYVSSKSEYWMIFPAYPSGSTCGSNILFFAKSTDRLNWTTYNKPVMNISSDWDNSMIYRSTILYDNATDSLEIWYSAMKTDSTWHVGYVETDYTNFLSDLLKDNIWNIDCGSVNELDGELIVTYVATEWSPRVRGLTSFDVNYALRTKIKALQTTGTHFFGMTSLTSCISLIANGEMMAFEPYQDGNLYTATVNSGSMSLVSQGAYNTNYHIYDIERLSGNVYFSIDDSLVETHTTNLPSGSIYPFIGARREGGSQICDWMFVRKYVSGPPTYAFGSEESAPTGVAPTAVFYGPFFGPFRGPI